MTILAKNCDITGLDKILVLRALWQNSKYAAMIEQSNSNMPLSSIFSELLDEDIQDQLIFNNGYINYLNTCPIQADFSGTSFDTDTYNNVHGQGRAEEIIKSLRNN